MNRSRYDLNIEIRFFWTKNLKISAEEYKTNKDYENWVLICE
ncbi:hypothetical protein [Neobacillus mesonae]|nr:hypothetical protein [Neobacillus mesonae]